MLQIRRSSERGQADHGWLKAMHTFSFADYQDPKHMGFRSLRVINEDRVAPGKGFGTHPHRDMEIITYVLEGELEHKDSMGNGAVMRPGDIQYMSAGSGVLHSEFNHSASEPVHLLQIWILPSEKQTPPRYDQRHWSSEMLQDKLCLVASPNGATDSIAIRQDASLYASRLSAGAQVTFTPAAGRAQWLQLARGGLTLNGKNLNAGDGVSLEGEKQLQMRGLDAGCEFLLFDLA